MQSGVLAGYNVVDVKVTLYDGSYHEVDSSEMAFKIAGSMAFKEAMRKADPVLLEPIMKVVVIVPEDYMGDVIGDINSRRGLMQGMEAVTGAQQINALVPAVRDVRLRYRPALPYPGPRPVRHGAHSLRGGSQERGRSHHRQARQERGLMRESLPLEGEVASGILTLNPSFLP